MTQNKATVTVVTTTESKMRGGMRGPEEQVRKLVEKSIPLDKLQQNFVSFLNGLQQIFLEVGQSKVGDFMLDEVSFSAEIGADGEFKLMGTGIGISSSSGVTFTLRRKPAESDETERKNDDE